MIDSFKNSMSLLNFGDTTTFLEISKASMIGRPAFSNRAVVLVNLDKSMNFINVRIFGTLVNNEKNKRRILVTVKSLMEIRIRIIKVDKI